MLPQSFVRGITMLENEKFRDAIILIGRVSLALLFVIYGYGKISGFDGLAGFIASKGLPLPQVGAAIAIVVELVGGLMVLVGYKTKWAALAIAIFIVPLLIFFHPFWSDASEMTMFLKNLSIMGGFLYIAAFGPGKYSIDAKFG
jgi:putative oxidoreductase